ncbi:protein NEN1-like [Macadamia integrifolia]|uniref:protein NEN1-like n=1 Tax=Macadamia integrifolia TaxID=60698 RepID=UPI001C4EE453|nr:protein NEN1-like [Macadamia integrifolia]
MGSSEDRSEIVFFDVETTIPFRGGQGFAILEFGAILVCPRKLVELESYSTLVKPADLSSVSAASTRCNGITRDAVASAPTFSEVADKIFNLLHGRIWAGHNIVKFDCARIREAFAEINRPAPDSKGTIDSLTLLTQRFGRRAGDMKMASLATYFGLGQQTHRSLDDVRMNLEVLKYCATVLFLESSLPDIFTANSWVSPNATTRSRGNGKASPQERKKNVSTPSRDREQRLLPLNGNVEAEVQDNFEFNISQSDHFNMSQLIDQMKVENLQVGDNMEARPVTESSGISSTPMATEGCSGYACFLAPEEVSVPSIRASYVPFYRGQRIQLLHKDVLFQLCCTGLRVRFGVSSKFLDQAGRPRLSIVVDAPSSLCQVLDGCDHVSQKLNVDSGSSSEWRPIVNRKHGFLNSPTIRLNIPTVINGDIAIYGTEIYQKEASDNAQRLVFSRFDPAELDSLLLPGALVDAYFSLDVYDYQQYAGIRLVAKKLIVHSR